MYQRRPGAVREASHLAGPPEEMRSDGERSGGADGQQDRPAAPWDTEGPRGSCGADGAEHAPVRATWLSEAADETSPGARYVTAHLAALRAAAAVVAARGEPKTRRRKPHSVWDLLPQVEPALTEWAAYFAAGAGKRAAAEAGLPRAASAREADDLLRDAETFLSLAETALGVEVQSPLPLRPAG